MKHFDPNTFLTDLSLNRNSLNAETDDVSTHSNEFVKVFMDTLDKHAPLHIQKRRTLV